jgi:hypothetical protein
MDSGEGTETSLPKTPEKSSEVSGGAQRPAHHESPSCQNHHGKAARGKGQRRPPKNRKRSPLLQQTAQQRRPPPPPWPARGNLTELRRKSSRPRARRLLRASICYQTSPNSDQRSMGRKQADGQPALRQSAVGDEPKQRARGRRSRPLPSPPRPAGEESFDNTTSTGCNRSYSWSEAGGTPARSTATAQHPSPSQIWVAQ